MKKIMPAIPAKYVLPLNMNGLRGRMLRLPAKGNTRREILVVYGHHASLERYWGFAKILNKYGAVTMPDLPGFGGMESFYKIGEKPSIDNLADYLATFVRWRYKNRRLTIISYSFGFVVVTRMLQKYPDIVKKVDLLADGAGFAHKDDFKFSRTRRLLYLYGCRFFSTLPMSIFFRYAIVNSFNLRRIYHRTFNAKHKFSGLNKEKRAALTELEIKLWHQNDLRTWMRTTIDMLTLDNCNYRVDLPLWHIWVPRDKYFNNRVVYQHLKIVYSEVHKIKASIKKHAVSFIAEEQDWYDLLPEALRRELRKV